jgi:hypothetical protein
VLLAPPSWDKQREFLKQWTALEAMRDELIAVFSEATMREFDQLRGTLNEIRRLLNQTLTPAPAKQADFEPVQDRFLTERQVTSSRMIGDMGFLGRNAATAAIKQIRQRAAERSSQARPEAE